MKAIKFLVAAGLLAACTGNDGTSDLNETIQAGSASPIHISDSFNAGTDLNDGPGVADFFIYTPLADVQPTFSGTFFTVAANRVKVEVRDTNCTGDNDSLGTVRKTFTVGVFPAANPPQYKASVTSTGLIAGQCYRIVMMLDNADLGFRDVNVVASAGISPVAGYKKWVLGQNQLTSWRLEGDMDTDDDGDLNHLDNCPIDANPGQEDTDQDGIGDACEPVIDNCPADPDKTEPGECGCGIPETGDTDGDGAHDCNEECDTDAFKTGSGGCGCGQIDIDVDGNGTVDACTSVANRCPA